MGKGWDVFLGACNYPAFKAAGSVRLFLPSSSRLSRFRPSEAQHFARCRSRSIRQASASGSRGNLPGTSKSLDRPAAPKRASRGFAAATSSPEEKKQDRHDWLRKDLHVVLVHPVIPQNTGSIARTCAATGIGLHLVGPMGFAIDDRKLKRAGLDYWDFVAVRQYESWQVFHDHFQSLPEPKRLVGFSKFASTHYATDGQYQHGDWLMFGSETTGLPDEVHRLLPAGQMVKIPMRQTHVRSLNLAVSAGIGIFEAIRQLDGTSFTSEQNS